MRLTAGIFQHRGKLILALSAFVLTLSCGVAAALLFQAAQNSLRGTARTDARSLAGTWRGGWHNVPAVDVSVRDEGGGQLGGTARFYRLNRTESGFEAGERTEALPLINPNFDGETLSFRVSNDAAGSKLIEAEMEMRLTGDDRAELVRVGGIPANPAGVKPTPIEMTRDR